MSRGQSLQLMAHTDGLKVAITEKRRHVAYTHYWARPQHFDPTKYGPDGERINVPKRKSRAVKFIPRGRPSNIRPADADVVVQLVQRLKDSERDLNAFLAARGVRRPRSRQWLLKKLANGWRPKK